MAYVNVLSVNLNRKIKSGLGVSLLILVFTAIISYVSIDQLIKLSFSVDHTHKVISALNNISSVLQDAEASQRGYLLTADSSYLRPYLDAYKKALTYYENVRAVTMDNPVQQRNLDTLKTLIDERFDNLSYQIPYFNTHRKIYVPAFYEGKNIMTRIRLTMNSMVREESRLLGIRSGKAATFSRITPLIIIFSSLLAVVISTISFILISRDIRLKDKTRKELEDLTRDLSMKNEELEKNKLELNRRNHILSGNEDLNNLLRGDRNINAVAGKIVAHLCNFLKAQTGAIYIQEDDGAYYYSGGYAFHADEKIQKVIRPGEGIIGQAVLDRRIKVVEEVPSGEVMITSALVTVKAVNMLILPLTVLDDTLGVVELLSKERFSDIDLEYAGNVQNKLGIILKTLIQENKTIGLLTETQNQAEELQTQQEELRQVNDELREQRNRLQASEEELRVSQEELRDKNTELEHKAVELEEQYEAIRFKNSEIESARAALQLKMEQVETMSKYKSEFLANMSHELRTPLNSILILARLLAENREKNLTPKQVEFSQIIQNSGNDLLRLINDVLDLAKIESGKINLELREVSLNELDITSRFAEQAREKGITFETVVAPGVPALMHTDAFRVQQILKNLLSNAIKFTSEGGKITFSIFTAPPEDRYFSSNPDYKDKIIAFSVKDTGIGIPKEKQHLVFEAFQQADSSTTRKFGGTGLGLSISRELAHLLGGEIKLESEAGKGSTFTLLLPQYPELKQERARQALPSPAQPAEARSVPQQKPGKITQRGPVPRRGERKIVIIEDDAAFGKMLAEAAASRGFSTVVAANGMEGLEAVRKNLPDAIILDIRLPDISGWDVLEKLKKDEALKEIPVHLMSAYEEESRKDTGNVSTYTSKPVSLETLDKLFLKIQNYRQERMPVVLLLEASRKENDALKEMLAGKGIHSDSAFSGREALDKFRQHHFDGLILDTDLPDMNGYEVLESLRKDPLLNKLPVIIYSGKELSVEESNRLRKYTDTIVMKTEHACDRLIDEINLFLSRVDNNDLNKGEQVVLPKPGESLKGKKVLIVDDDMRNIYSLYATLEQEGMNIIAASDGVEALKKLEENSDVDIILMDLMMPEMDGLECIRRIRTDPARRDIPVIALTAKAMKEDRENSIAAGASDYISKPVDTTKLLSLMQVWLYQKEN